MKQNSIYENEMINLFVSDLVHQDEISQRNPVVLFVLDGKFEICKNGQSWILQSHDFLFVNAEEKFSFSMEETGIIGKIELKYYVINTYLNLSVNQLNCNSFEKKIGMEKVRQLLQRIINLALRPSGGDQALLISTCYQMLYYLREYCLEKRKIAETVSKMDDDDRLGRIEMYILEHYNQPVTLQDLADETYFSTTYLSKYIKKKTGKNLTKILTEIRLEHALKDVQDTEYTFTKIAMDHGFSNAVSFNKAFQLQYEKTPSEYRKSWKQSDEKGYNKAENKEELNVKIQKYFTRYGFSDPLENEWLLLKTNVSSAKIYKSFWSKMINGGAARDLLRGDVQKHLAMIREELGIQYVRFWDIYAPEMMLYDGNEEKIYNFSKLDIIIDFLYNNKMYPYLELGFKPVLLMKDVEDYLINEERQIIFDNTEEYGYFLEQFFRHYIGRYDVEEVNKWYFEEWRDTKNPDFDVYLKYFETLYTKAKIFSPDIKVGGAGFGAETKHSLAEMLSKWKKRYYYPDFISLYGYPYLYESTVDPDILEKDSAYLSTDDEYMKNHLEWATEVMHNNEFLHQEIHLSEWNFTVGNRNGLNDSIFKGAYIVKNLIDMIGKVDFSGYWFASDRFTEYYDTRHLIDGSGGLISKDGIRKPAYWGFMFFNRLEKYILDKNENAVITSNLHDSYSIVCHNFCRPNYMYYQKNGRKISVREASKYYDMEQKQLQFEIKGVRNGSYQIKTRTVDENYGSVLDEWKKMDYTDYLNAQDIKYLQEICVPHISIETVEVADGVLQIRTTLEANAIKNIHVYYVL